jgi:ATP phosphoribosyltransferase
VLRIAVPNKGMMAAPAAQMLREAGYRQRPDDRDLVCRDDANDVEFFYLRPRDIATYVGSGDLDLGITGRDLLVDSHSKAEEILDLDFAGSTFHFAARPGNLKGAAPEDLAGRRIATAYPGVVERYLASGGVSAEVIPLDGAVENAVRLGVADVIADVALPPGFTQLLRRLQGVLVARRYVMLAYDVPTHQLDAAVALTPGIESPTISPLRQEGWVAVEAMVLRAEMHRIMDELYDAGARAILVTDIHACRL